MLQYLNGIWKRKNEIEINVEDLAFNNYSYFIPEFEYSGDSLKFHFNGDSSRTYKFKNFGFDIDSLMSSQGILLDSLRSNNWNQFYNFNDSLIWKNFPGFENYFRSFKEIGRAHV